MPVPIAYITVMENIIIVSMAYLLGYYLTSIFNIGTSEIGGLWSVISGMVVIEGRKADTFKLAKLRITGSCIGALVSVTYLYFFPFRFRDLPCE
jgi:uncharacterized membrane protein YgaE (UPF0421/DUF939 family)